MTSDTDLEASVLRRLQRGDVDALEVVYRRFGARVLGTCRGLLGNSAEAEDATQEVFIKVLEHSARFEGRARFSTWLYQLTVNHCLHVLEKLRRRRAEPLDEDLSALSDSPSDAAGAADAAEVLARRLALLPLEHRTVLVLREIDGLSYDEIAGVLGIPSGTVMSRLARARERWTQLVHRRTPTEIKP